MGVMPELVFGGIVIVVGGVYWWFRKWSHHQLAVSRIPELAARDEVRRVHVPELARPVELALPWILGMTAFVLCMILVPLGPVFAVAVAFLFWVVGLIIGQALTSRRVVLVEAQLAEAIDHMVTSLHAGVGVVDALGSAEQDTRRPLKPLLTQFVLRLRLGDDADNPGCSEGLVQLRQLAPGVVNSSRILVHRFPELLTVGDLDLSEQRFMIVC